MLVRACAGGDAPALHDPPLGARRHPRPAGEKGVDKADMQKLRESSVFGPLSFWVTEMRNLADPSDMGSGTRVRKGAGACAQGGGGQRPLLPSSVDA